MHEPELRTDFKNVMLTLSPLSSNQQTSRTTPTKCGTTPVKQSCTAGSSQYESIPDSPSNSRSSDMFRLEKENLIESAQKTPSTTDLLPQLNDFPRVSFRKSLIFDTGMTPEDNQYSKNNYKRNASADNPESASSFDAPKARTSLSFGDKPQISAKTFYGSSFNVSTPIKRSERFTPKQVDSTKPSATKRTRQSITRKTQLKNKNVPFLGNLSISHKIHKPKPVPLSKCKAMNRFQIIESAMDLIGARVSNKPSELSKSHTADEYKITREQIDKLQKIIRDQPNTLSKLSSKPLSWTGSLSKFNSSSASIEAGNDDVNDTFGHVSLLNNSELNASTASSSCPDQNEEEEQEQHETKRKFFKSRRPSTSNNYTVMKGIKATVKRGAEGVTLLMAPESKKAKRDHSDCEYLINLQMNVCQEAD